MDDQEANLQTYQIQLQQVEAALTTSPDSKELLKLKADLEEVIQLTIELIKSTSEEKAKHLLGASSAKPQVQEETSTKQWMVGDKCLALWVTDGHYYEATIESIEGEEVTVLFSSTLKGSEVTTIEFIKEFPKSPAIFQKPEKRPIAKLREYQKKKKQKKQQRFKQLEEEKESEKNKWLAFASKTTKKGVVKKSIFASPDNVNGRVGIGTCGVSGKGMTDFTSAEKWRKGV